MQIRAPDPTEIMILRAFSVELVWVWTLSDLSKLMFVERHRLNEFPWRLHWAILLSLWTQLGHESPLHLTESSFWMVVPSFELPNAIRNYILLKKGFYWLHHNSLWSTISLEELSFFLRCLEETASCRLCWLIDKEFSSLTLHLLYDVRRFFSIALCNQFHFIANDACMTFLWNQIEFLCIHSSQYHLRSNEIHRRCIVSKLKDRKFNKISIFLTALLLSLTFQSFHFKRFVIEYISFSPISNVLTVQTIAMIFYEKKRLTKHIFHQQYQLTIFPKQIQTWEEKEEIVMNVKTIFHSHILQPRLQFDASVP
jgi:hypothetical protein